MWDTAPPWRSAGLFVVGTDTGVGKTVVAAAVASLLSDAGQRTGVCKPFASGCEPHAGNLVSPDANLLKHFARCPAPIDDVSPVRYEQPVAPAVAAEGPAPWRRIADALARLDAAHDAMVIEGVGGLLVPLDRDRPELTVLDLAAAVGYPVLIVARPSLGTLNHTAMTVRLLRGAGCTIAGVVLNAAAPQAADDASIASNRQWIERMNDVPVIASIPFRSGDSSTSLPLREGQGAAASHPLLDSRPGCTSAVPSPSPSSPRRVFDLRGRGVKNPAFRVSAADEQAVLAAREILRSVHWGEIIGPSRPTAPFPSTLSSPAGGSMPS